LSSECFQQFKSYNTTTKFNQHILACDGVLTTSLIMIIHSHKKHLSCLPYTTKCFIFSESIKLNFSAGLSEHT